MSNNGEFLYSAKRILPVCHEKALSSIPYGWDKAGESLRVMKIFCCYTKAHEVLLRDYFAPSLPTGFELHSTRLDVTGPGDFLSNEFLDCIRRKVNLIVASLRDNPGEILIWSDIDIVFLRPVAAELDEALAGSGKEILFQREGSKVTDINAGFFVCRSTPQVIRFFEQVGLEFASYPGANEQWIINKLLRDGCDLSWGYLPLTYYARTHGWPPGKDIAIYHANETPGKDGVGQKIRQFKELRWIRKYGLPALAWSCLGKIPKRLNRLRLERAERAALQQTSK